MTKDLQKTLIVLVLSIMLTLSLPTVALSLQPAGDVCGPPAGCRVAQICGGTDACRDQVNYLLQVRPSDYPTLMPTPVPVVTPGPTRGPVVTSNPDSTPHPGGRVNPTPVPSYHLYPGIVKTPPYNEPVVQKPLPTLIPRFPAGGNPAVPVKSAPPGPARFRNTLQITPIFGPSPTYSPPATYEPQKGYGLPMNPHLTPTPVPSGGATYSHDYGLPYHPISTSTPVPSGGLVPVKGYRLPYHPASAPTPRNLPAGVRPVPGYHL